MDSPGLRRATLHQLKVFETVARRLSFSRAAEELHLTQPAVSIQVKQLEGHAGAPLIEHIGRRTHLTAAGETLLHHCHAIIGQFREADDAMAQFRGVTGGTLNVAVISAGDYFFPQLLAEFSRRHARVKLNLTVANREEVVQQLAENRTDLAVMVRAPGQGGMVAIPFAPAAYVIVASPGHPLVRKRRIALETLLKHPFVARERASDTWNAMENALGERLAHMRVLMEISSNETIKQAVMAGLGLAFLSADSIIAERRLGSLAVLDVAGFPFLRNWNLVHHPAKRLSPVAIAFKAFLLEEGAGLIGRMGRGRASTTTRTSSPAHRRPACPPAADAP